jgi:hypothetical protein
MSPIDSLGQRIYAFTIGSRISSIRLASGNCAGLSIYNVSPRVVTTS